MDDRGRDSRDSSAFATDLTVLSPDSQENSEALVCNLPRGQKGGGGVVLEAEIAGAEWEAELERFADGSNPKPVEDGPTGEDGAFGPGSIVAKEGGRRPEFIARRARIIGVSPGCGEVVGITGEVIGRASAPGCVDNILEVEIADRWRVDVEVGPTMYGNGRLVKRRAANKGEGGLGTDVGEDFGNVGPGSPEVLEDVLGVACVEVEVG